MSILRNAKELDRLIMAFEQESQKFHKIKLHTVTFRAHDVPNFKYTKPNHAIMLWQYYGSASQGPNRDQLIENLSTSDMQWGMRGCEMTAYSIIEGKECELFMRMAERAAHLFDSSETTSISSKAVKDVADKIKCTSKPVMVTNSNKMAVWLNYIIYHFSLSNPHNNHREKVSLDPFTLSLLALEEMRENPTIKKSNRSLVHLSDIKFDVAFSFAGEKREYVSRVAEYVKAELGENKLFYDFHYQSQIAQPNADTLLQNVYRNQSKLIVVFISESYSKKEWCGVEFRAIRDIVKQRKEDQVMLIKFDNANVDGIFSTDGYIDARKHNEKATANFIIERIQLQQIQKVNN